MPLDASSNKLRANKSSESSVSQVSTADFASAAQKIFLEIDRDHNGYLSVKELGEAVEDGKFKGQDAQVIAALYENREALQKLSRDEWGRENSGITVNDLAAFGRANSTYKQEFNLAFDAYAWAIRPGPYANFAIVDKDKNGFLSKTEIEDVLSGKSCSSLENLTAKGRGVLEYLLKNFDAIESESNDEWGPETRGITMKDLEARQENVPYSNEVNRVWTTLSSVYDAQIATVSTDLYVNARNPLESIKPGAIKQGVLNDCYFLASLASLAISSPETILHMIKENNNCTYTVTFPGAADEPITITPPTEAELGLYNQGGKYGIWASVLEKAYGVYCQQHFWRRPPNNYFGSGHTPEEGTNGPGLSWRDMHLLTGKNTNWDYLPVTSADTTKRKLEAAFNAQTPEVVTVGTVGSPWHVYSILGFDPKGPGGGTLTVRDPGEEEQIVMTIDDESGAAAICHVQRPGDGAVFPLSFDQFIKIRSYVAYTEK